MTRKLQSMIVLLIAAILLAVPIRAETHKSDDDLLKVRETVWRAWFAGDAKLLRQLVPVDTIVISARDKEWKSQSDVLHEAV